MFNLIPNIDRYILRLTVVPMLGVFALAASLLMLDKMLRLFDFVAVEGGPVGVVFKMLGALIPEYASLAIPLGLLLGVLLAFRKLATSSELDTMRAAGLSSIVWRVLATLHVGPPLTVSQLAHEVLSKQPTVTKLVQRMHEQGWVAFENDPADQRRTLVSVTAAGRRLVRPLVDKARAHEATLLSALPASEKAALKKTLLKLTAL